jgi:hypothetical protein
MAGTDDLQEARRELALVAAADVAALIGAARQHGLEAWLAACAPALDGPWAELAAQRPRFLAARARTLAEARSLGRRLDGAGCPWAVLKGLAISQTAYPRPDLRHGVDLDVLVPPARFEDVVDDLVGAGYQMVDVNWPLLAEHFPSELRLRAPNGILIDLHWHLLNGPDNRRTFRFDTNELLERSVPLDPGGLRVLRPADQLVHTALHATLAGGDRLLWLVDLDRLARRTGPDWDEVIAAAAASRAGLPVAVAFRRARLVLGTPIPEAGLRRLAGARTWLALQDLVDSRSLLRCDPGRPGIARALARSARQGSSRSHLRLAGHGLAWLASGAPRSRRTARWLDPDSGASALHPVPDAPARAAYFTAVAGTP